MAPKALGLAHKAIAECMHGINKDHARRPFEVKRTP